MRLETQNWMVLFPATGHIYSWVDDIIEEQSRRKVVPDNCCLEHNKKATDLVILYSTINGSRYSRMDQVKIFKGYLPQILHGPFLNTFTQILLHIFREIFSADIF